MIEIDIEKLKKDLVDYYGTAMFTSSKLAIIELSKIEKATEEELIKIALNNKFDLDRYAYNNKKHR